MKIIKIQTLKAIILLALGSLATVFAGDNVETAHIALYQPDNVLVERKVAPEDLAAYIQKLTKILEDQIGADAKKEALDVVVMVRPEKKVRVWFVSSLASPEAREPLAKMLEDVVPVDIVGGPLAFAIS